MRSPSLVADLGVQFDVQVYSGLCITIPPRSLKRKLHDLEAAGNAAEQPKVCVLDSDLVLGLKPWTAFSQGAVERVSKAMNGQTPDLSRTLIHGHHVISSTHIQWHPASCCFWTFFSYTAMASVLHCVSFIERLSPSLH